MTADARPPTDDPARRPAGSGTTAPVGLAALAPSAVVYLLLFTAVGCWIAYAAVLFADQGLDLAVIGLLASVPAAVAIVGSPTWGLVADRLGDVRPPLLAASLWGAAAASLLVLQPPMPWVLLVVVVLAAGTSGMTPLVDARTVERLGRERDRFGQARAFGSVGFIAATLAVGFLVQAAGTPAMLVVYIGSLAATGVVGAAVLGRRTRAARASGVGPVRAMQMLRDPGMGLFFAGSIVMWVAATGVMAFFSLRLIELGGDARLVGIGWAANAILEIPTMLAFRRLANRIRASWLLVVGAGLFVVRAVLFTLSNEPVGLILASAIGGIGFGLVLVATTTYVASRAPSELRATAQALFSSTAFSVGMIVGTVLGGLVASAYGLAALFPVGAAVSLVGAVLVWAAIVRRGPDAGAAPGVAPGARPA